MDAILPSLITAVEVGQWLSLSTRVVERMARRREIPSLVLPSGELLFDCAELAQWAQTLRGSGASDGV
jgi:hypothetical protein